jgi:hypothetical protein
MAEINYYWTKTSVPIRISEYADNLGFNLRTLDRENTTDEQLEWVHSKIRNKILSDISECWEADEEGRQFNLASISQGIYVITLSDNLSIDYNGNPSKVLYIGRGQIRIRLYNHMIQWLRHFTESLQDISFDIWMSEIKVKGSKDAYKNVESDLINYFYEKFKCLPIQNSSKGHYHEKSHTYCEEWNKPLKNAPYINKGWAIKPLENNPWSIAFEDED